MPGPGSGRWRRGERGHHDPRTAEPSQSVSESPGEREGAATSSLLTMQCKLETGGQEDILLKLSNSLSARDIYREEIKESASL